MHQALSYGTLILVSPDRDLIKFISRIQYEELDVNNLMSQVGYGDDLSQLQADFKEVATQREEEARPQHKERFTSRSRENRRKRIAELRHHYFHEDEEEDDASSSKDF